MTPGGSTLALPGTDYLIYCDTAVGLGSAASALSGLTAVSGKVPWSLVLRGPSRACSAHVEVVLRLSWAEEILRAQGLRRRPFSRAVLRPLRGLRRRFGVGPFLDPFLYGGRRCPHGSVGEVRRKSRILHGLRQLEGLPDALGVPQRGCGGNLAGAAAAAAAVAAAAAASVAGEPEKPPLLLAESDRMTVTVRHGELTWGHRGQAVEAPRLEDCLRVPGLLLSGEEFIFPQCQARGLLVLPGHVLVHQGSQRVHR